MSWKSEPYSSSYVRASPHHYAKEEISMGRGNSLLLAENMAETLKILTLPQLSKCLYFVPKLNQINLLRESGFHGDDANFTKVSIQ
jgi:hypothetical protein